MICYSFVKNLWNGRIKGQKTLYRITLASNYSRFPLRLNIACCVWWLRFAWLGSVEKTIYQFSQLRNITESKGRLDIPFLWQSVKLFATNLSYATTTRNTQSPHATRNHHTQHAMFRRNGNRLYCWLMISLRFERAWCVSVRVIKLLPQDSERASRLRTYVHASRSRTFEVKWSEINSTGYCQAFPFGLAIPGLVPRLRTVCIRDLGARLGHLATSFSSGECYCVCERVNCNSWHMYKGYSLWVWILFDSCSLYVYM